MIAIERKKNCCGCGACETICPSNSISMYQDEDGFFYPRVEMGSCIGCNACERVCPILNTPNNNISRKIMYACANNDGSMKYHSSSGGVFHLIATYILSLGGVVFGVVLSNDCRSAMFICAKNENELLPALGSKYIQARPEKVYIKVQKELKKGIPVLFSGTPCQVAALQGFLNKKYDNLYLLDLSCHGVPSEKAWNRYLDCREKKTKGKVVSACFRSKESGWKNFSIATDFSNGQHNAYVFTSDSYGKAFTKRLLFRPSCEHCKFKGLNRWSDITLGDFWGINEISDKYEDDKGTSLVIIHTEKGNELFNQIKGKALSLQVTCEQGTRRNPYLYRSVVPHSNKERFFGELGNNDFDELVEKYATDEFVIKDFIFDINRYIKRKLKLKKG